jgi:hypothetical protein
MRNLSSRRRRMSGGSDKSLEQGKNFINNQAGGGAILHGAPVLAGDAMLLEGGDLRGKALMGPLDASTAAIRGMQDGGRRSRGRRSRRKNSSARRSRRRRGRNNASARSRRRRNNASARSRRRRNNASARSRRGRNNASARSRRRRNNASARSRRRRNNNMYGGEGEEYYPPEEQYGGEGEEDYPPEEQYGGEGEEYENGLTPLERRRNNMYGGAHSILPIEYAPVTQPPSLLPPSAAARAGTAFTTNPFANGSGSA